MKKINIWLGILLFLSLSIQSCTDENEVADQVSVRFTFPLDDNVNGRSQSESPKSVLLSLTNSAGTPVFTQKEVKIFEVGDRYLVEPIELPPGRYSVTDFLLVSGSQTILYAIPKKGSPLEKAVIKPLPFSFNVNRDRLSTVDVEVIDVSQKLPEDFGYVSFNINAVNPLRISVFERDSQFNFTKADAYIIQDEDTLEIIGLSARTNLISFGGDVDAPYTLVIKKEGFNDYIKEFLYQDLTDELDGLPLSVYLIPSTFTMLAYVDDTSFPENMFKFTLEGMNASISIDWGDGFNDLYVVNGSNFSMEHVYATPGNFLITVTGELEKLTYFYSFYGEGQIDEINIEGLINLEEIRLGLTRGPSTLDLSNSPKLRSLLIAGLHELDDFILPEINNIDNILISELPNLSINNVDDIINKVYDNAVGNNVQNGNLQISNEIYDGEEGFTFIGPPSPGSMIKLRELRDTYGWTILPDPG